MKVAVLGCFYDCADALPKVLEPWIALKKQGFPLVLGGVNAQFREYADLGFPNNDEGTRTALRAKEKEFDVLHFASTPLTETETRNTLLVKLLAHDVDIVWLLDGDEFYTQEHIKNILEYLARVPRFDYYHIHFDNRVLDTLHWEDAFFPPRIFRTDRHGGVGAFTWDNELTFADGTRAQTLTPGIVPKEVAHVLHRTWQTHNAEKKIAYHKKHFGYCAFHIDKERHTLEFDPEYFAYHHMPMPSTTGESLRVANKETFDVILRTHAQKDFRPGLKRATDVGKHELAIRSLRSLVHSLLRLYRRNEVLVRLTIVDDHSSENFLTEVKKILSLCPFESMVISIDTLGNAASMEHALTWAKEHGKDFLYFVEDDYLHEPTALEEMLESYRLFSKNLGRHTVALFPVDYSDFYLPERMAPTRVVLGSRRHWRVSYTTTSTFFIPKKILEEQWALFLENPRNGMHEDGSLNVVWQEHAILFSPIPTLAYHLNEEASMPPFSNWRRLWEASEGSTL